MARVTVQIVTWNSRSYLAECLDSLRAQEDQDFDLTVIDNASVDGTVAFLEASGFPRMRLLRHTRNLGFARAHNIGFQLTSSPYVLVMNPDAILTPNFLRRLVPALEQRPDVGSASGKLLRFELAPGELREVELSDTIDSAGLEPRRDRRVVNRGEGERDRGQYDRAEFVFGQSGSLVLCRTAALRDVADGHQVFDEDFFAYHEDVDLAWRLQWRGWRSWYQPDAVAYHHRAIRSASSNRGLLQAHRSRTLMINRLAYKNHLLTLVKNEPVGSALPAAPWLLSREIALLVGYLITAPRVFTVWPALWRQLPQAFRRRQRIFASRRQDARALRRWFR